MKPSISDVQELWSDLKGVTSLALDFLRAKPVDTKRVALFETVPVVFPIGTTLPQKQEVTWVNPAGDAYFTEVGHEAIVEVQGATPSQYIFTVPLMDSEIGLVCSHPVERNQRFPAIFDFEWNFRYGRNKAQYGIESSQGGTDGYLSRKSFGNKNRGSMLGWSTDDPLVVLAGDSITWTILPTLLHIAHPVTGGTASALGLIKSVTINLFMSGFRTGTPAEADYELGR